jgi:DNA (cytosine-5)-methyltransferase 1
VVKALVAAPDDVREEILARMEVGARIDNKEISAIRRRLHEAKLTPTQVMAERQGKLATAAARKSGDIVATRFKTDLFVFVNEIAEITDAVALADGDIRQSAAELLERFDGLFGSAHKAPESLRPGSTDHCLSCARLALEHLGNGTLPWAVGIGAPQGEKRHPWMISLYSLSGHAPRETCSDVKALDRLPADRQPTVIELCAGAGGMSLGLERAGFDHVVAVEFDRQAAATLRKNRPEWTVIQDDIRSIDFSIMEQLEVDLVAGGLPCQPYSSDGYGLGKNDPRDLWLEGVRVVSEVKPKAFVFENVDGFLHAAHSDHIADIVGRFRRAGYQVDIHRMRAESYGIAQERSRVLVIGLRDELAGAFRMPPAFPERRMDIGTALVDLMAENGWEGAYQWAIDRAQQPVLARDGSVKARGAIASTIVTRRGKPREKEAARWGSKEIDIAGLPFHAPTAEEALKPGFKPALTARMRARLQDFPDDWEFCGGRQAVADQIGNAVPVRMAQAVGLAIHAAIRGVRWDMEAMLWPEERRRMPVLPPSLAPALGDAHRQLSTAS